jgi:hypothetical protein
MDIKIEEEEQQHPILHAPKNERIKRVKKVD